MRILVPVKRVPDPYGKVRLTADGRVDESDIKSVINPFDEIALEQAVRIRESGVSTEIVAASIGAAVCEEQLRAALAMGADRGLLILDDDTPDPRVVSRVLAELCKREAIDLVLMGKQAIDDDSNQTGQRLAALLQLPQATFVSGLTLAPDGKTARAVREVDTGRETLDIDLPAVVTTDLRLNEPRYVALPAIIKARSKPVQRIRIADLISRPANMVTTVKLESPPPRRAGRKVSSVDELISALRNEAHVI
jgi:electron transfer flavoprotein beta subunit